MAADYLTKKLGKQKFEYCMLLTGQGHVISSDTPKAKGESAPAHGPRPCRRGRSARGGREKRRRGGGKGGGRGGKGGVRMREGEEEGKEEGEEEKEEEGGKEGREEGEEEGGEEGEEEGEEGWRRERRREGSRKGRREGRRERSREGRGRGGGGGRGEAGAIVLRNNSYNAGRMKVVRGRDMCMHACMGGKEGEVHEWGGEEGTVRCMHAGSGRDR
ncbi:unnamed protein product [Closterium sp. NIES-54]